MRGLLPPEGGVPVSGWNGAFGRQREEDDLSAQ
jgi:hypothetical protein